MMDQGGNPSQNEDSNYNLYDTYGTGMDDDVGAGTTEDGVFPLVGWDHHHPEYPDTHGTSGYDPSTEDFGSSHYQHGFGQSFEHDGGQFQDFMAQDQHDVVGNEDFD